MKNAETYLLAKHLKLNEIFKLIYQFREDGFFKKSKEKMLEEFSNLKSNGSIANKYSIIQSLTVDIIQNLKKQKHSLGSININLSNDDQILICNDIFPN